jgi:hypothetical protein
MPFMVVAEGGVDSVFSIQNTFIQLRADETSDEDEPRLRRRCNSLPDLHKHSKEVTAQMSEVEASTVASSADSDAGKLDDVKALTSDGVPGQQADLTAGTLCEPCGYSYDPSPATCAVPLLQPVCAGSWTPYPRAVPSIYQQCEKIANQVRARLLAKGHAYNAQVTYDVDGSLHISADVQDISAQSVDRVLASAMNAIVSLAAKESSLFLIGRSSEPFTATTDGFGMMATLGTAPEGEEFCWDFYEQGYCPRKDWCCWAHPSACVSLTVAVKKWW